MWMIEVTATGELPSTHDHGEGLTFEISREEYNVTFMEGHMEITR